MNKNNKKKKKITRVNSLLETSDKSFSDKQIKARLEDFEISCKYKHSGTRTSIIIIFQTQKEKKLKISGRKWTRRSE